MTSSDKNASTAAGIQSLMETIAGTVLVPVNKAGWPFILAFAVVSIILALISPVLGTLGLVATLWCIYFFRDPIRTVPEREGLIVSPADGKVTEIRKNCVLPPELDESAEDDKTWTRVSIFLSVFDVHVNRVPCDGTVVQTAYRPGVFVNAALDKASEENERAAALIDYGKGRKFAVVQIAGWVARRILNDLKTGQTVRRGERLGIIRFGSRVDVYLPEGVDPLVIEGQYAIGGETIIADLASEEPARTGRKD